MFDISENSYPRKSGGLLSVETDIVWIMVNLHMPMITSVMRAVEDDNGWKKGAGTTGTDVE